MKVVIYIYDHVPILDFAIPYDLLRELPNTEVVIASPSNEVVQLAGGGIKARANYVLTDIMSADVLWVCGGTHALSLQQQGNQPELMHALYRLAQGAQMTVGIAEGAALLAKCGFLKDKKATALYPYRRQLKKLGALVQKESVVLDGNTITTNSHGHVFDVALAFIKMRFDAAQLQMTLDDWGFVPNPPFKLKDLPKQGFKAKSSLKKLLQLEQKLFDDYAKFEKLHPTNSALPREASAPRDGQYRMAFYLFHQMRALDFAVCWDALRFFPKAQHIAVADKRGAVSVEGNGFELIVPHAIQEVTRAHFLVIGGGESGVINETNHAYLMHWLQKICPTTQRILTISDGVRYLGVSGILTEYESYIDPNAPLESSKFMMAPCFTMAADALINIARQSHGQAFAVALQRFVIYGDIISHRGVDL